MMAGLSVFDVAAQAMASQMVRMNTVASNLANADSVASSPEAAYHPLRPVTGRWFRKQEVGRRIAARTALLAT